MNHATNALALVHQVKGVIDVFQSHGVSDESVHRDFTLLFDDLQGLVRRERNGSSRLDHWKIMGERRRDSPGKRPI
jgi:hypothetical protein